MGDEGCWRPQDSSQRREGRALTSMCTQGSSHPRGPLKQCRGCCVSSQTGNFPNPWHQVLRKAFPSAVGEDQPWTELCLLPT